MNNLVANLGSLDPFISDYPLILIVISTKPWPSLLTLSRARVIFEYRTTTYKSKIDGFGECKIVKSKQNRTLEISPVKVKAKMLFFINLFKLIVV